MLFPTTSASQIKIKLSFPIFLWTLRSLQHYHHHILNTFKMGVGGETDEKWGVNPVSFVSDDNPVSFVSDDTLDHSCPISWNSHLITLYLVLAVFRFNWVKYCLFDISSFALV